LHLKLLIFTLTSIARVPSLKRKARKEKTITVYLAAVISPLQIKVCDVLS